MDDVWLGWRRDLSVNLSSFVSLPLFFVILFRRFSLDRGRSRSARGSVSARERTLVYRARIYYSVGRSSVSLSFLSLTDWLIDWHIFLLVDHCSCSSLFQIDSERCRVSYRPFHIELYQYIPMRYFQLFWPSPAQGCWCQGRPYGTRMKWLSWNSVAT